MPPPRVRPVTPVEPTTPPGVTRPCCWVAASKSSQVAPPPERAMPRLGIDLDLAHPGEVDDQPVVDGAVAGGVVASAPHRDLESLRLAEGERRSDVVGVDAAGDRRRPPVDQQVEAEPGPLVLAVGGCEHVAGKAPPELSEIRRSLVQPTSHRRSDSAKLIEVAADQAKPTDRFRILCVDGGGIRGLIPGTGDRRDRAPAPAADAGPQARASDYFQMFAGTSTGGLVALSLTAPDPANPERPAVSADQLARFYTEDGPGIFHRSLWQKLRTLWGWLGPKYTLGPLQEAIERRLGNDRDPERAAGADRHAPTT